MLLVLSVRNMVRVMAVGVFDLLHAGHLHYVEQAKSLGDELIVVVAHDDTCLLYTSPSPRDRQKSRMPSSA